MNKDQLSRAPIDFAALREKRNADVRKAIEALAREFDPTGAEPVQCNYNFDACYCACPEGPCEHKWDGVPYESDNCWSTTCSRCGCTSMSHDMRVCP